MQQSEDYEFGEDRPERESAQRFRKQWGLVFPIEDMLWTYGAYEGCTFATSGMSMLNTYNRLVFI